MPLHSCSVCGLISTNTRCPQHTRHSREAQRQFAKAVAIVAGHRCQAIEDGARCIETEGLQAHHTQPRNDDPDTGLLLCREHHRQVDRFAR